ncbi:MAG: hypothetical protein AAF655_25595 [Bacteroidota bacterium]
MMSLRPKTLLIYYAWPSVINGAEGDVITAANELSQYDYLVLGAGLAAPTHENFQQTVAVLAHGALSETKVFGYIDVGVSPFPASNFSLTEIAASVQDWKNLGVYGILLDNFGYDFGLSRDRQNAAVGYVKSEGMKVIANGWNPDDVFGTLSTAQNPNQTPTLLDADDIYLSESYQIQEGAYQDPTIWKDKAVKLEQYQRSLGFSIFSVTTNDINNAYVKDKADYSWYSAVLYGHEAWGWGEYVFSAQSDPAVNGRAPSRPRPTIDPGDRFTSAVTQNGTRHSRRTNQGRPLLSLLSRGTIWVDTADNTYRFWTFRSVVIQLLSTPVRSVREFIILIFRRK